MDIHKMVNESWAVAPSWVKEHAGNAGWLIVAGIGTAAWKNRKRLYNATACATFLRGKRIRLSASGLVRVQIDGKYLLVRGNRIRSQFQPVGGVFKYYSDGKAKLVELQFELDSNIKLDDKSREDLRISVPGQHFPALMRWYDSAQGRESNPWREFFEELVKPGFLSSSIFPHANFRSLKRFETWVHWSEYLQTWEVMVSDIYELVPTEEQEKELRQLMTSSSTEYIWITADAIRRRGVVPGEDTSYSVSPTAKWLL